MATDAQEWLFRRIVENSPEAILYADREGVVRLWNSGAEAMFGYKAEEVLGKTLDLIIPENLRGRHWEGFRRVMETGATRYGRELLSVPAIRKDGARISLEFSILLLRGADGKPQGAAAILRDVTERWKRERAMREELEALRAKAEGER